MGAKIGGIGTERLPIQGVDRLHGATYAVMADRIEAGSYACAAAITGGEVELVGAGTESMEAVLQGLRAAGVIVEPTSDGIAVRANGGLHGVNLSTAPFPAFPTDMPAPFMAMSPLAAGASIEWKSGVAGQGWEVR